MLRDVVATIRASLRALLWPLQRATRKPCDILRFTLKGTPPALPIKREFWDRRPPPMSIRTFQRRLKLASDDEDLSTILVDIEKLEAGWSTLQTLHDLLVNARRNGKRVIAHIPEGGGLREYYVATAANEIWLGPSAALSLTGFNIESTYFADAFERAGLRGQVEAVGRFKTAGENLVRDKMTPENREMLEAILGELEALLLESMAETRQLGPVEAQELIGRGPYSAESARELGLIDGVCYPDQLAQKLAPKGRNRAKINRWKSYAHGRHVNTIIPLGRGTLPVVEIRGMLVEGKNKGLKGVVGARDVVKQLRELKKDPHVPAVILYIDSRGGTVGASDQIRREVERLGEKKPVIAYMANVAASGGYMVSAAAQTIVAQRSTLTGSIGVLAGKVSGRRLLEGLGIKRQSVRLGDHTAFDSLAEGWSASERRAVRELISAHYQHFINVVARGRRIPTKRVEDSAQGRVWTGGQALERGLIDQLGGLAEAIAIARETSSAARRALVKPVRPPKPKLPMALLPKSLATAFNLLSVAEKSTTWAIEPVDLRIH